MHACAHTLTRDLVELVSKISRNNQYAKIKFYTPAKKNLKVNKIFMKADNE